MLKPNAAEPHASSFRETGALQDLIKRKWRVSLIFSLVILGAYFSFIVALATVKDAFATPTSEGGLPLGIPLGVGLIAFAWLLTGVYALWANAIYDRRIRELLARGGN